MHLSVCGIWTGILPHLAVGLIGAALASSTFADQTVTTPDAALVHAAGVSLAEVSTIREVDSRPGDGNLEVHVKLKTVQKSGTVLESIDIVKIEGGLRPRGSQSAPDPFLTLPFQQGKRYWFVWSSRDDQEAHRHQIITWWPEDSPAAKIMEDAVAHDRFAWEPHYDPRSGITYDHHWDEDAREWRLRGCKDAKVLWEIPMEGKPYPNQYLKWDIVTRKQDPSLAHAEVDGGKLFLCVVTSVDLPPNNAYQVPAGECDLASWYDMESGHRAAVAVRIETRGVDRLLRTFDRATNKSSWERTTTFHETGGKAVSADTEKWTEFVERTFSLQNGNVEMEEHFRSDGGTMVKIAK